MQKSNDMSYNSYRIGLIGVIKVKNWIKRNVITTIAIILAIITCFFVPINKEYLSYFDYKTLICLTCILAVVQCLKRSGFFEVASRKVVSIFKNSRSVVWALIMLTFLCDLFLVNDMSLITLLPLTYLVLSSTNNMKYFAFTLILQNIAANMSGMITPHGNPQNLYLYSYYNVPTLEFIQILLPHFFIVLGLLIILPLIFVKKEPLKLEYDIKIKPSKKIYIYLGLFVFSLLIIFRVIPYVIGLVIVLISVFILDKESLKKMDWDLLLTFCAFFVFSGNVSKIPQVSSFLKRLMGASELLTGLFSCQFISNVPTAVLLSKFTTNYKTLITAVNIGSLGTLISSLASLITLKEYLKHENKLLDYVVKFTLINLLFLSALLLFIFFVG